MKIISLVVFLIALIGSWFLSHREATVPESVHAGIQSDLKQIITEYVQKNLPNAKGIVFKKFWTETIAKNKIKATFAYTFDDTNDKSGSIGMEIDGYAILNKVSENAEQMEWSFDELHINNNSVEFKDPLKITSKPDAGEEEPPASE
jgi:hypothetical protein